MKVLFAASEANPFIKTGGLGDVMGALPKSLNKIGVDVRVVLPKYKNIKDEFKQKLQFIKWFTVPVGWRNQYCGIFQYKYQGVIYYFIDNEYYFNRDGLYGYFDDGERFAFFINRKSFPKRKSYQQVMFSICVIRALQQVAPLASTC